MKVDKVNLNSNYSSKKNSVRHTNFTGISQAVVEQEINKLNPPILKGINKFRSNIGELQDICINAMGTGLLAPIFIKYNPLSKTDEDTRTYSAWRQPVSAVLAIATQGLITIPVVKLIKNMANKGYMNEECNLTPFKDRSYIESLMKEQYPHATKKQLAKYVDNYIKQNNTSDLQSTINSLRKENTVYYTTRDLSDLLTSGKSKTEKRVKIDPERHKQLLHRTVDDMIKKEDEQLKRCREEKFNNRFARSEFYRTNNDSAQKLLDEMRNKINSTDNVSDITNFLKSKRKQLKSNKANRHLINMVEETIARADAGKDIMLGKVNKMQSHVSKYKGFTSAEQVKESVKASIAERVGAHEDAINFLRKVKEAINNGKTVSDIEKMFEKQNKDFEIKAKKLNLEDTEFRFKNKKFAEEVASKLKMLTEKHIEGVKRISTLVAALAILPLSCSLLNWIYPRFMDAVFPNLSNKKHDNESKELVDKATKNSEVK